MCRALAILHRSIWEGGFLVPSKVFLWSTTIDANPMDSRPYVDDLPCDAASVRRRSIAAILLRNIRRCVAADREFDDESSEISAQDEPVFGHLGDSLPEPLDFVSDKPLSMYGVFETPGFGDARDTQLIGKVVANAQRSSGFID